jgi:tRNA uridine 5-carbamoylmethylation protein Kti12
VIILFCGIPGSGKTTIADKLARRLNALGRVRILSSDRLKAPVYRRILKFLETARGDEDFLILDATFYKKDWREKVAALAAGEKVATVYLHCAREVALARNRERRPNIAERALHIVYHRMEPPDSPDLRIDTASVSAEAAAERIYGWIETNKAEVKAPVLF